MAVYETSLKTREALIQATGELAAKIGFASVTIRAIAAQAGENVGSIHYHFGSKKNLFAAVVQTAAQAWKDNPVSALIKLHDISTPEGQAEAIRAIVHRNIKLLFGRDRPDWHCRVIFQVMRGKSSLREIFKKEVIIPSHAAITELFRCIDPNMDKQEALLRILVLNTPVFFHADRMDFILAGLQEKKYPRQYLQKMEDIIVLQTQLVMGLPAR